MTLPYQLLDTFSLPPCYLVWLDLETSGVEGDDLILEMGWKITKADGSSLGELSTPRSYVINHVSTPEGREELYRRFRRAHPIVRQMHSDNGLWNELWFGASTTLYSAVAKLEHDLQGLRNSGELVLAGSSVQSDMAWLKAHNVFPPMLSHRIHDMTTIRRMADMFGLNYELPAEEQESPAHRVVTDIERDVAQWHMLVMLQAQLWVQAGSKPVPLTPQEPQDSGTEDGFDLEPIE